MTALDSYLAAIVRQLLMQGEQGRAVDASIHTQNVLTLISRKRQQLERDRHRYAQPSSSLPQRRLSYLHHSDNDSTTPLTQHQLKARREQHISRGGSAAEFDQQEACRGKPILSLNFLSAKHEQVKHARQIQHFTAAKPIKDLLEREDRLLERKRTRIKPKPRKTQTEQADEFYPTFSKVQTPSTPSAEKRLALSPPIGQPKPSRFISLMQELRHLGKDSQRLQKLFLSLRSFNPLFSHLQRVIGVCLLRVGQPVFKRQESTIYKIRNHSSCFYIILHGSVALEGSEFMNKVSQAGQTLLEETFEGEWSLERAWALTDSWLLSLAHSDYRRMQGQLMRFGFKQGVKQLDSMIRRNYLNKKWLRKKYRQEFHSLPLEV